MCSSPIKCVAVAESLKERWLSEDSEQTMSLAFAFDASYSNTTIGCDETSSSYEESAQYLDDNEPLESFLDYPDLFGSFGDFSWNGNDEDLDGSNDSIQTMTKPQEEDFIVLAEPQTTFLAQGFSWNKAKVVRMLSMRSLMLEAESGEDDELSVVHSVSTQCTQQTEDTFRVDVPGDHDPGLAVQLSQMSRTELYDRFLKIQKERRRSERKRDKARRGGQSSKKSKSRQTHSSDHKKSSEHRSSRDSESKDKVKKERSHRTRRASKTDEDTSVHSSPM